MGKNWQIHRLQVELSVDKIATLICASSGDWGNDALLHGIAEFCTGNSIRDADRLCDPCARCLGCVPSCLQLMASQMLPGDSMAGHT